MQVTWRHIGRDTLLTFRICLTRMGLERIDRNNQINRSRIQNSSDTRLPFWATPKTLIHSLRSRPDRCYLKSWNIIIFSSGSWSSNPNHRKWRRNRPESIFSETLSRASNVLDVLERPKQLSEQTAWPLPCQKPSVPQSLEANAR